MTVHVFAPCGLYSNFTLAMSAEPVAVRLALPAALAGAVSETDGAVLSTVKSTGAE